jgi:hypothetical protein
MQPILTSFATSSTIRGVIEASFQIADFRVIRCRNGRLPISGFVKRIEAVRKLCVYLDTSVFGGTNDEEFSTASRHIFKRVQSGEFVVLISQITMDELQGAPLKVQRVLQELPANGVVFVAVDSETTALAQAYLDADILGQSSLADALHVAAATVAGADLILSWNFRHIVNYDRIHKYNGVNALKGYPAIEIHSPLEIGDADENQNL